MAEYDELTSPEAALADAEAKLTDARRADREIQSHGRRWRWVRERNHLADVIRAAIEAGRVDE